jgi:hypothetical protein
MKEFNKEEYNKMCAEFLGFTVIPAGTKTMGQIHFPEVSEAFLKYDSDWNCIMEVVNKIKPIVSMSKTRPLKDYNTDFRYALISAKKEVIVKAIWEFLNWVKENKK